MSSQPSQPNAPLDLDAIRARLSSAQGPRFWRSLEEVAGTAEFQEYLEHEFTPGTSEWTDPVSRRRLVELLGATLGLAGLTACTKQPPEAIVPYVRAPEEFVPGRPLYYATAIPLSGYSDGVLVESHMGRPTKVEGNPEHPASHGSTDVFRQASILTLYDPDRSQAVAREGRISSWVHFLAAAASLRETLLSSRGAGFRILTETITSPSLLAALRALLTELPEARWCQFEPVSRQNVHDGTKLAFGEVLHPVYHVDKAAVIVSLDADLFGSGPGAVRYSRDFAARRKLGGTAETMNRLYVVEPCPSITGGIADHRLALTAAEIENFARALAVELGAVAGLDAPAATLAPHAWVKAVASDLLRHKGAGLVAAGAQQSAAVHALAHAINTAMGNNGATVSYLEPIETAAQQRLPELAREMHSGHVSTLLMLGGNPLYTSPADVDFGEALRKVKLRIHLGEYDDETSAVCHWHINEAHPLESWGDTRAYDGTITVQQPLIEPLYNGRSAIEVIAAIAGRPGVSTHDLVKEFWHAKSGEEAWQRQIHDGLIAGSAGAGKPVTLARNLAAVLTPPAVASGFELNLRPDASAYDGRFANNGWLQELPRPITKITWDNAVLLSPASAQKLNLATGDVVELRHAGRTLRAPACIVPGHADASLTLHLGYGRWRGGRIANNVGANANRLRASDQLWWMNGVQVFKTGGKHQLAITQEHNSMEGRNLVRSATLAEYIKKPDFAQESEHAVKNPLSLFPEYKYEGYSWGMAIDLNACTGCNACTIACQAENNIAVVGKTEVLRGREMHWIRLDRYFEGSLDDPTIHHQPVACMQCDNAPCEVVCPVAATSHSNEGLNQMTYNRCVGTRYCANNCPYKVRRFNFFLYGDWESKSLHGLRNPDVTVRSRGVMEKCTYCVQRINLARIEAEKEDRRIADGEVVTACQAVCPAQAIYFGDLNDPKSRVAKVKLDPRNYGLLTGLNTRPRTSYLARIRNPNPELEKA